MRYSVCVYHSWVFYDLSWASRVPTPLPTSLGTAKIFLFVDWSIHVIILFTELPGCCMNNVFKQFLILCGKGFLLYSLIWLMMLFRARADRDFLPPSFPVRIGSGKHENGARMCICTFQGKNVSHPGTLLLFLTLVVLFFHLFYDRF